MNVKSLLKLTALIGLIIFAVGISTTNNAVLNDSLYIAFIFIIGTMFGVALADILVSIKKEAE